MNGDVPNIPSKTVTELRATLEREGWIPTDDLLALLSAHEEANDKLVRLVRGELRQICSYCGWESAPPGDSWDALQAHVAVCPVHPVGQLRSALQEFADMPCETAGLEDMEPGCCRTCRARKVLSGERLAPETSREPKAGDEVTILIPLSMGQPRDGWKIREVRKLETVFLDHPNGSFISLVPGQFALKDFHVPRDFARNQTGTDEVEPLAGPPLKASGG